MRKDDSPMAEESKICVVNHGPSNFSKYNRASETWLGDLGYGVNLRVGGEPGGSSGSS